MPDWSIRIVPVSPADPAGPAAFAPQDVGPGQPLEAWDGIWYRQIAQHGYDPVLMHGNTAAFFPLYPTLLSGLRTILPFFDIANLAQRPGA